MYQTVLRAGSEVPIETNVDTGLRAAFRLQLG